ncbi:PIN domain-containing protein [uncultured Thiothrix sp.]|uniref:PIN domain-containing protein n=1 Tax=uncultured Thiothrix sp. TaxID=223185 RepID=UPI00260E258A|nr:type II toxin-antitoxin system VapC family toxin [uncultured Thiothrix sp.]
MIGLDTNVLVRYLIQDDELQSAKVNKLIESLSTDKPAYISQIVLVEVVWVLTRAYKYSREQITGVINALLSCREFMIQYPELAILALQDYQQGNADYSDYLLARVHHQAGANYTATLDQKAGKGSLFRLL